MSDADLVALVRSGDDDAFEHLYRRHHAHVTAVVARMLRDRMRTEDIVQDVFLSALRRLRQTESEILFRAWVSEIARNASIDHFRRAGRTNEVSIDADQSMAPTDVQRLSVAPSPEVAAIGRERFGHLRGALDELSESHQRVIVLRELEGHSYREIGQLMDLSPSGVESTLFRARRRLEQEYEQLDSGVRCIATQAAVIRIADGDGSRRDRRKLHRHASRCSMCRRLARANGIEPMLPGGLGAKVAAWLPLPALLSRRRTGIADQVRSLFSGGVSQAPVLAPATGAAWEQAAPAIGKGLALIAAVTLIGQGAADTPDKRAPQPAKVHAVRSAAVAKSPSLPSARSAASRPARPTAPAVRHRASAPRRAATVPPASETRGSGATQTSPRVQPAPAARPSAPAPAPAPERSTLITPRASVPDVGGATTRGAVLPAAPKAPTEPVAKTIQPVTDTGQQVTNRLNELLQQVTGH